MTSTPSRSRGQGILALGVFLVLAVVFSWPLVARLSREIPASGQPVDPQHILYGLCWGATALLENPFQFFHATFFFPYSHTMAFLDQMFSLSLLAAPILLVTGSWVAAYNGTWLLTFALSGWGAFLLTRHLTRSAAAGYLAGILFAFHPFRFHSSGILHVVGMMWIPFALLMLHRWVETERRRYLYGFLGFSLAQFLASGYTGAFLVLASALYLVVLCVLRRDAVRGLLRRQWRTLALIVVLGAALLLPFLWPSLRNVYGDPAHHRSLGESALWSARPADFLTPGPGSLFHRLAPFSNVSRQPLFPGLVASFLILVFVLVRGWRGHPRRAELIFYVVLLGAGALLSLGPFLEILGLRIPMPFAAAFYVLPGASFIRSPVRFFILASLAIAVLAGAAVGRLPRPRARRAGLVASVLAGGELLAIPLLLFDPLPGGIPEVYPWLAAREGPGAIVELPMPADEGRETVAAARYQLYSLHHRKRLVNGVGAFVPTINRQVRREMQSFPSDAAVSRLQELGVVYVLVHGDAYPPEVTARLRTAVESRTDLRVVTEKGAVWVIEVSGDGRGSDPSP
jgi:hypothetical protein